MSRLACAGYVKLLNDTGLFPVLLTQSAWQIQNIVASGLVDFAVDLCGIQRAHSHVAHYDASLFPGCIIKEPSLGGIRILIFRSGKCVLTGAKSWEAVLKTWQFTKNLVKDFKDTGTASSSEYHKQSKKRRKRALLQASPEMQALPDEASGVGGAGPPELNLAGI